MNLKNNCVKVIHYQIEKPNSFWLYYMAFDPNFQIDQFKLNSEILIRTVKLTNSNWTVKLLVLLPGFKVFLPREMFKLY